MNEQQNQQGQSGQSGRQQPNAQRDMAGLLGGLLGGQPMSNVPQGGVSTAGGQSMPGSGQPNDVADILGGLLGGGASAGGQSQAGGGGELASVLGGLLGGGAGTPAQQGSQGGTTQPAPSGGDLMGMLGGLLGGNQGGGSLESSVLSGLLGSVIGNHQASHTVAQHTGLSQELVQALLPMIMGMLLHNHQPALKSQGINVPQGGNTQNAQEFNQVAQRVQQGEQVNPQEVQSAGFTKALAQHSGYSEDEVAPAVVKILQALSQHAR